ncbi:acyltransferase [Aureimonas sp. AU4]|uniref:acyltransferase family protein n=1 Tax=Aureimonas sp. AU4 TaxID=1638163 RepID=UPI0007067EB5|nr:acyltransferase [Aureimonas sp. AU4]BAT30631.1 acyltransferase 3 [Aureimonas sp. AU4]
MALRILEVADGMSLSPGLLTRDRGRRSRELQWLRAVAALSVVVYHAGVYLERFTGDSRFAAVFDGRLGFLGVAIFFALSGYLMAEILPRTDAATFLVHRLVRIYPIFLIIFGALYFARRKWLDFDVLALSLVPIGEGRIYYLGVEWTLLFEITFYVLLYGLALLGLRHRLPLVAGGWLLVSAGGTWAFPAAQTILTPTIDLMPIMAVNAAFAGGLLIPSLRARGVFNPVVAAVAVIVTFGFGMGGFGVDRWVAAFAAVVLVGLCVSRSKGEATGQAAGLRILDRYGDWSYALYLCHVPLIIGLLIGRPPLPTPLLWVAAIVVPLLIAIPFGIIDVWLYRRLRRVIDGLNPSVLRSIAALYAMFFIAIATWAATAGPSTTLGPDMRPSATPAGNAMPGR